MRNAPLLLALSILTAAHASPALAASTDTTPIAQAAEDRSRHDGEGALLRLQVLLDRARFSPGEIDAVAGSNQARALRGYQAAHDLPVTGEPDPATWSALERDATPVLDEYRLTEADLAGPYRELPEDAMDKAKLDALGHASLAEALGERFHASPARAENGTMTSTRSPSSPAT